MFTLQIIKNNINIQKYEIKILNNLLNKTWKFHIILKYFLFVNLYVDMILQRKTYEEKIKNDKIKISTNNIRIATS